MKHGHLGNEKTQAELRRRQKALLRQRREDMAAILKTPQGRRFFWDLIDRRCNLGGEDYVPGGLASQRQSDFNAGARRVGQELKADVTRDFPDLFTLAFTEAVASRKTEAIHREATISEAQKEDET